MKLRQKVVLNSKVEAVAGLDGSSRGRTGSTAAFSGPVWWGLIRCLALAPVRFDRFRLGRTDSRLGAPAFAGAPPAGCKVAG